MNSNQLKPTKKTNPIFSDFSDDDSMGKIIQIFLNEIPQRIELIESSFHSGNKEQLCKIIHQLKGAGGGYGFKLITSNAMAFEKKIKQAADNWQQATTKALEEFVDILHRAYAGRADSRDT